MKGHHFITICSVLVAVASVAYAAGRSVQAQATTPTPVQVTNSASQCVPASIYHSIALPAVQSGAWNVGEIADKLPFQRENQLAIADGSNGESDQFTVPSGKRLVIDNVALQTDYSQSGAVFAQITITNPSTLTNTALVDVHFSPTGYPNTDFANLQTHLIAEAGQKVGITVLRNSSSVSGSAEVFYTMTGHYAVVP